MHTANRDELSSTHAANRFLLVDLPGAGGATPALSARTKDSLSPLAAVIAASSASASAELSSSHSTVSSYSSSSSSPSVLARPCPSLPACAAVRFGAARGGLPNSGSVVTNHVLIVAISTSIFTERLLR